MVCDEGVDEGARDAWPEKGAVMRISGGTPAQSVSLAHRIGAAFMDDTHKVSVNSDTSLIFDIYDRFMNIEWRHRVHPADRGDDAARRWRGVSGRNGAAAVGPGNLQDIPL